MLARLTSILAIVVVLIFNACNDVEIKNLYLTARIYNEQTLTAELSYLATVDISKLTDLQEAALAERIEELEKARAVLQQSLDVIIHGSRCLPLDRPPLPCPRSEGGAVAFHPGTEIELDLIGYYLDQTTDPNARVLVNEGSAQLVTTDGKKVFAQGSLNAVDSLFHTAWYQFEVQNPTLASRPLVLKITTQVIVNHQIKPVTIEKPVPAGTFLGHNIY